MTVMVVGVRSEAGVPSILLGAVLRLETRSFARSGLDTGEGVLAVLLIAPMMHDHQENNWLRLALWWIGGVGTGCFEINTVPDDEASFQNYFMIFPVRPFFQFHFMSKLSRLRRTSYFVTRLYRDHPVCIKVATRRSSYARVAGQVVNRSKQLLRCTWKLEICTCSSLSLIHSSSSICVSRDVHSRLFVMNLR